MRRAAGYSSTTRDAKDYIPNLPGYAVKEIPGEKRVKQQICRYVNGYPIMNEPPLQAAPFVDASQIDFDREDAKLQPDNQKGSSALRKLPPWLAYDKKVLIFYAYHREILQEQHVDFERFRKCVLRFYLEDNTLEIVEPTEENSGLVQGRFLRRHKVELPEGRNLAWTDILTGKSLSLYGRTFHILACDDSTRKFYASKGIDLNPDLPYPVDSFAQLELERTQFNAHQKASKPPTDPSALFHLFRSQHTPEYEGKVLTFYCCWDDTAREQGLKLPLILTYYLMDNMIEIREVNHRNSGRDPFPLFLKRGPLPKKTPMVGARPLSPYSREHNKPEAYNWQELMIGKSVMVYGRELLLYDCDAFTRNFYKKHLKVQDGDLRPIPVEFVPVHKRPEMPVPEHAMKVGSEEDTLRNVDQLVPKVPLGDYRHYLDNWNKVMRFQAQMVAYKGYQLYGPSDVSRKFTLSFFIVDDSLSIWEPPTKNSGIKGGMFLERTKVLKPSSPDRYSQRDMHIGAILLIYGRAFLLTNADEYTLVYMERNAEMFPWADYRKVVTKLQSQVESMRGLQNSLRSTLVECDAQNNGYISCGALQAVFLEYGLDIPLHEFITISRGLGEKEQQIGVQSFMQLVFASTESHNPADNVTWSVTMQMKSQRI